MSKLAFIRICLFIRRVCAVVNVKIIFVDIYRCSSNKMRSFLLCGLFIKPSYADLAANSDRIMVSLRSTNSLLMLNFELIRFEVSCMTGFSLCLSLSLSYSLYLPLCPILPLAQSADERIAWSITHKFICFYISHLLISNSLCC